MTPLVSPWILALVPPVLFGWVAARRLLKETDPFSASLAALGLGLAGLLLGVDLLLPHQSMQASLLVSSGALGLLAWACLRIEAPPLRARRQHPLAWLLLLAFLAATLAWGIYALADAQVIEGDFFIHAAQFGLFQAGRFPPQHPFYPDTPLHGHYGRPLMVAIAAVVGGVPDLTAEWVLTLLLQALTLLLLFTGFRRAGGSAWVGLGAAGFAFFAVNVGYRAGLMDTLQNHNAAAWFFVALSTWCILPLLAPGGADPAVEGEAPGEPDAATGAEPHPGMAGALVGGLVLGASQFVYETNFGLQWLGLALLAGLSLAWEPARRPALRPILAVLVISALLACVEGGVVTSSLAKRLGVGHEVASATQAAGQEVSLRFPKERLLQVRLSNLTPAKPFETKFKPWKPDGQPTDDYAPLWDPRFFSGFWLTAWLAAVPIVFLWRKRQAGGLWFAAFGLLAVLVPATVDFGPVFEFETFRWLFACGLGLAIAWGVTLPAWVAAKEGRARAVALGVALLVTWYCFLGAHKYLVGMQEAYRNPLVQHPTGLPAFMPDARYLPDPYGQLAWQFKMTDQDLAAAAFLREHASPGESFAGNLEDWSANPKGALVGMARTPLYGHSQPFEDRELRPPMYSPSPQSTVFWAFLREDLLVPLGVDWLFVRTDRLPAPAVRLLDEALEKSYASPGRRVYRVPERLRDLESASRSGFPTADAPPEGLRVEGRVPRALPPGQAGLGTLRLTNTTSEPLEASWWAVTSLRHKARSLVVNPQDPIRQRVDASLQPGASVEVPWFLAAPYAGGEYLAEGPTTGPAPSFTVREVSDEERFRNESAAPAGWR